MQRAVRVIAVACALALAAGVAGCGVAPVERSRPALGTAVAITAYGEDAETAVESAYLAIAEVEAATDAYDPNSAVSAFNSDPYTATYLPPEVLEIREAVERLGVSEYFSVALLGVVRLYSFESSPTVPAPGDLALAVAAARGFTLQGDGQGVFARVKDPDPRLAAGGALAPGLDLGGAAKGLALDRAYAALATAGAQAAVVSAGSTTVTLGSKPDDELWRVGIEDPRDPATIVAVISGPDALCVSTSGDYQQYFESAGARYHHILDPSTGSPARRLRSLTVFGPRSTLSGLEADILSTALFVMGPDAAIAYAEKHGLGIYLVDDEGRAHVVPAPETTGIVLDEEAEPTP
ncbi:MAG: FAD:protein FMN transferase [Coriobacteriia bacterium]